MSKVSADTDDLDAFVDHGRTLQPQMQSTFETCGPTSCAMGLDTLGHQVDDVDAFVRRFNVRHYGMTPPEMVSDLNRMGIRSTARLEMSVDDVARQTRHGAPMIVRVEHPTPGGSGHFVIVDGVTTRFGQKVVAIRDPFGRQYFEAVDVFEARFSGHGLTFEG